MPPNPDAHVGPYRLVRELGRGGMGVVHEAVDTGLDRRVALKIIAPRLAGDPAFRAMFTREAQAQASLDSPHVVTVFAHGEVDGSLYIATQLVPDGDLGALLRGRGAAPPHLAVDLISQVATGLADAHAAGLVHRDVKPANVLVRMREDGVSAYLADFGLARRLTAGPGPTADVTAVGTPGYMAPELHAGGDSSPQSDVYALGCLLWAALCGRAPYSGATDEEVVAAHASAPVPQLQPAGPWERAANDVLRTALAKSPTDRYPTAASLRDDLRSLRQWPAPAHVRPTAVAPVCAPPARDGRPRALVVVAAMALALLLAGGAARTVLERGDDERPRVVAEIADALAADGTVARKDADCVARELVERRGVDGLVAAGILDEQHHVNDMTGDDLGAGVLGDIVAIGSDCILSVGGRP